MNPSEAHQETMRRAQAAFDAATLPELQGVINEPMPVIALLCATATAGKHFGVALEPLIEGLRMAWKALP